MNKVCKKYCDEVKKRYGKYIESIIIYGSNIYNLNSSDLDLCLVLNYKILKIEKEIIEFTIKFHEENNLKLDEEVPYENKLLCTFDEIEDAIMNSPFYIDGKASIKDIVKTKEFLSSKEMKKRLLINILTTDHITIGKSTKKYEDEAIKLMIKVIKEFYHIQKIDAESLIEYFYTNPKTKNSGEMYLGYKNNRLQKHEYLLKTIKENII